MDWPPGIMDKTVVALGIQSLFFIFIGAIKLYELIEKAVDWVYAHLDLSDF
jgi:hypothetical protein